MKYTEGDRVIIQSYDWFKKNNFLGTVICGLLHFNSMRTSWCEKVMTIAFADSKGLYRMREDDGRFLWNDEMIEGLVDKPYLNPKTAEIENEVKENKKEVINMVEQNYDGITLSSGEEYIEVIPVNNDKVEIRLINGYEYVIDDNKLYFQKKKKEYPKTYEECGKILGFKPIHSLALQRVFSSGFSIEDAQICAFERNLTIRLEYFRKLLICRDAYWKIAGEEMGLGKPWKPDWNIYELKFCLGTDKDKVIEECVTTGNRILAFPTEEMLDAFYENFKELIEECKELI